VTAILAALFVAFFTIDLGPALRQYAEKGGSNFIKRPMRIGRLSAKMTPGVFVVEDLVIEGLSPQDHPFITAKKITVKLPWWTAVTRKLVIESIEMTTGRWSSRPAGGRHNFRRSRATARAARDVHDHAQVGRGVARAPSRDHDLERPRET
jgi:hypothetical protein